jgi:hypothetical protein
MKKATSIILLFVFLFNSMGYLIVFKTMQYQAKKEIKSIIKNNLKPNELTEFCFAEKDLVKLVWLEKGKEFIHNGTLYDIVRTEKTGEKTVFCCINDKQEEQLFADLEEQVNLHIASDKPVKNDSSKQLVKSVLEDYFFSDFQFSFINEYNILKYIHSNDSEPMNLSATLFIPPPELA